MCVFFSFPVVQASESTKKQPEAAADDHDPARLVSDIHAKVRTCIHTYIHTYMHTYIHTYTHAYIRTCTHTCMHAYIQQVVAAEAAADKLRATIFMGKSTIVTDKVQK